MYPVARLGDDLPFLENRLAGAHLWVAKVCMLRCSMLLGVFNIGVDLRARLMGDNTGITVDLHVDFVEMLPSMPEAAHSGCAWATNIGSKRRPKPVHHIYTVSWQMLMPRSNTDPRRSVARAGSECTS